MANEDTRVVHDGPTCPICHGNQTPCCRAVQTLTGCCQMVEALKGVIKEYQALAEKDYLSNTRRELNRKADTLFAMAEHLARTHAGLGG